MDKRKGQTGKDRLFSLYLNLIIMILLQKDLLKTKWDHFNGMPVGTEMNYAKEYSGQPKEK